MRMRTHERDEYEIVRLWLLSGFRVSLGARTIGENAWGLRKAAAIVKLLALSPGHRLHREQVMNLLWPHLGRQAAANNLRRTLHAARRVLDPDPTATNRYLAFQGGQIALSPGGRLWVDVEAFKAAAATARCTLDPASYRAALDLYAGDLLPEDRYEEWVEGSRAELRTLYLALLVELTGLHEERGEYKKAIEASSRILSEEPTREEAHAGLMRLYALSGKRGEAIRQYERLESILRGEIGVEPTAETQNLRGEIMTGSFPPETDHPSGELPNPGQHNLPEAITSFVGREREVLKVRQSLAMTGLLTLTGAGGAGKTRLALEVAQKLASSFQDGVWLVELAGFSEGALVPQAVASALEVREQPGRSLTDTLVDAIGQKKMLLLLDNCEHLAKAAAGLVEMLLSSCRHLKILATSREPLDVSGEVTWRVPPLSMLPAADRLPAAEDLGSHEAIRLFVERARLKLPMFELTLENAGAVAEICRKLDGIPLAIELAAARMDVLAAGQIAERLDRALGLLGSASRAAEPRHQTLRGTLDWSYELLSECEQKLFKRLSMFAGGFSLEAAEAVGIGEDIRQSDILELFLRLVDKSLIVAEPYGKDAFRYRMLEPVRQYAAEKLKESGKVEIVSTRHARFFLALVEAAEPELRGVEQGAWLERLETEHDNLRVALSWALEAGETELGLRLAGALGGEFWHMRGYLGEGRRWLEAALASGIRASEAARARALACAGLLAWEQGDYERSVALGEESLALSRKLKDKTSAATALYTLAWAAMFSNELERASELSADALALQREMNDRAYVARTLLIQGLAANGRCDYERAMALHEQSLALARETGDGFAIVLSLAVGAYAYLGWGDHRRTSTLYEEGLELSRQLGMPHLIVAHLHAAACLAGARDQPVRSARLWGAGESLREEIGTIFSPVERDFYEPYIDAARAQLGEVAFKAAWAEGKATMPDEAIEYALGNIEPIPSVATEPETVPADKPTHRLTRREREVAVLVGRGMTNRCIASELVLSRRTVETHVRNILKKLGLSSSTQLAALIAERRQLDAG